MSASWPAIFFVVKGVLEIVQARLQVKIHRYSQQPKQSTILSSQVHITISYFVVAELLSINNFCLLLQA